jgi:hypothetical protein
MALKGKKKQKITLLLILGIEKKLIIITFNNI